MSGNITHWKTNTIKDLRIPLASLKSLEAHGFSLDYQNHEMLGDLTMVIVELSECGGISGVIMGDEVRTMSVGLQGRWSGTLYREHLLDILKASRGELEATIIWEGSESAARLHVLDGVITETPVEVES